MNLEELLNKAVEKAVKQAKLELYPVGSYWLTEGSQNPADVIGGGVWEKIYNRFLLGADSEHPAGSTGGEEKHTLTVSEMPSHNHQVSKNVFMISNPSGAFAINDKSFDALAATDNASTSYGTSCTSDQKLSILANNGSSQAHNNVPQYRAVNIWRRTS